MTKNSETGFVPTGGSSVIPRNWVWWLCRLAVMRDPPGGFWKISKNPISSLIFHKNCNPNPAYITIQSMINQNNIIQNNRNSPNLDSLLNLLKVLLLPSLSITLLLSYQFRPQTSPNTHNHSSFVLSF